MSKPKFYNRENERRSLSQMLKSDRSELIIIYGRRGVGKSALLEQALASNGEAYMFYRATRRTLSLQMEELANTVREAFPDAFLPQAFTDFSVFLNFLSHRAETHEGPVIAVIDELPYLADADPGLLTVIQHWWDANKRRPNIKLFFAGSYVAFMERKVLDINAPLYNRRTGQMMLLPMDYAEAALFFPQYTPQEKMEVYAILGGLPSYLEQFNPVATIEENVKNTVLRQNTYLSEEPDWLLLEDLRKDTIYGSILRAIAGGERKPSDIARAIGKNAAQDVNGFLETLKDLKLVVRQIPITESRSSRSRNSLYWIDDQYIDFWYRFVDPSRSLIARGIGERLWDNVIAPSLQEYVSKPTFERACREYLWRALMAGVLPDSLSFTDVGTWWGAKDREIDVVALTAEGKVALIGECKWRETPMDVSDYADMLTDIKLAGDDLGLSPNDSGSEINPWLIMFSRSGFTPRLEELANSQNPGRLLLVTLDQMYEV